MGEGKAMYRTTFRNRPDDALSINENALAGC